MSENDEETKRVFEEIERLWQQAYADHITGRAHHYRLVGQTPVPCSLREWTEIFSKENRRVRLTYVGPYEISTVFLGLDHNHFGRGPAILFETMTFLRRDLTQQRDVGDSDASEMDRRYTTWEAAEAGHQRAVEWVRSQFCSPGEEPQEITGADAATERPEESDG